MKDLLPYRFDVSRETHVIDFANVPHFEDPIVADACVEVATSDGKAGTLSHLAIGCDTKLFAQDLRELVGNGGVPVCLSGGCFKTNQSYKLVTGLISDLSEAGFKVSRDPVHSDVMGFCSRRATIFPDRVEVQRTDYQINPSRSDIKILRFPESRT